MIFASLLDTYSAITECLFVSIRKGEIGNKDLLLNFIATSAGLKEQEAIKLLEKKMKNGPV